MIIIIKIYLKWGSYVYNVSIFMSITLYFKNSFSRYIQSGVSDYENAEEVRKAYIINAFTFVGILFVFPLGINAFLASLYPLAFALLSITMILVLNYFYFKVAHHENIAAFAISIMFFLLMTYLVYAGGVSDTGPLWIYPLPIIIMFLLGFKRGLLYMTLFFVLISFILFALNGSILKASYPDAFKIRIILSLMLVTFLASAYEYFREKAFTTMQELSRKLEEASYQDHLTEVYNRRGIHKELENACKLFTTEQKNFSILLCDIDHFKKINDTHGHMAGDEVLKRVALEIKTMIRKDDALARWGGEEFLILLPHSDITIAHAVGEKIRKSIENTSFSYDEKMIAITVSIGIAEKNKETPINHIINQADEHMYQAKKEGRNTVYPNLRKEA